jgi:filamentous hemagglutinin family protein
MKKPTTFNLQLRTAKRLRFRGRRGVGRWAFKVKCFSFLFLAALLASIAPMAFANPGGLTVASGTAAASTSGSTLTVTASANAWLNWQSFNIASGETTAFVQPSSTSIVWNSIGGGSVSEIYGSLQANGVVVLMNSSGFYFGPDSCVKAAGVIVSTAAGGPVDSGNGTAWQFTGPAATASIINYGKISADSGGFVYLLGANIDNAGSLTAPAGNIGLCAGQTVLLSERADGRGLSAKVTLPTGSVNNSGQLVADAGTILASAKVVNQNGLIEANSVSAVGGIIELDASDTLKLGSSSVITANGDNAASGSAGGQIMLQTAGTCSDASGSQIQFKGGANGGDGGRVLVYAASSAVKSTLVGTAQSGYTAGSKYYYPRSSSLTLDSSSLNPFDGFASILFQSTGNLTIAANTTWNLADWTGSLLQLEAGGNLTVGTGSTLTVGNGWNVTLEAGRSFSSGAGMVTSGTGNITFSGTAGLQAADGDVTLLAGNNLTVSSGYVRTVAGGSITATAVAGSVNTGTSTGGYDFSPIGKGYVVDSNLGGISTAAGGDVTLTAGLDIISYLPVAGGVQTDAGSGCFGSAAGNVTLVAGRNVTGHYVVANGTGTIVAGNNAGTTTKKLALSLVAGGWNVTAANDIILQEVRNPNGIFNDFGTASSATRHYFDYADDAYVILTAGNGVTLAGTALPRYLDSFESSIPCIYPSILIITAGAGGVTLGNDVILFPSAAGWLSVTTTDGGALTGSKSDSTFAQLILSDSGKDQYLAAGDFGIADHADTPVHINDDRAVELNISGDMEKIYLVSAEKAEVNVGGDMINCRFDGQNLHDGDVTSINVAGAIQNRSEFTSVTVSSAPDYSVLADAYPPLTGTLANLANLFHYDAATGTLTFQGRMTTDELNALLNLTVPVYDAYGQPIYDSSGNPVTKSAVFISDSVLQSLYYATQDVPSDPDSGFRLGGGGTFSITAGSLDLGATAGIVAEGPAENSALANYFTQGADIVVNVAGDIDMFSTTISGVNGGNISVTAGGSINLGSTYFTGNDEYARGIFSTCGGDVTVVAGGDIDINGSRIATYDGGDLTVESLHGDVNVGSGGSGSGLVGEYYVDPVTRKISSYTASIPGSGILATTFPKSLNPAFPSSKRTVGNILVETPEGNITSTSAGIVQVPLNNSSATAGTVTLIAGTAAADGSVLNLGNIDVSGGGVIGANVTLKATGDIKGTVVARNNLDISALQNVSVTALAGGMATVNAGDTLSGTLIGMEGLNVSGITIEAALLSPDITASGNVTSQEVGFAPVTAAGATRQGESADAPAKAAALLAGSGDDEDGPGKGRGKGGRSKLVATGRVTVLPSAK